jgi:serine/threonine protein kinase
MVWHKVSYYIPNLFFFTILFHRIYRIDKIDLNKQQFAMVLQYADGGSLREYLEYNKDLTWFDKLRFAQEITKGILWIHDKKIIHRDLVSLRFGFFFVGRYYQLELILIC